MATLISRSKGWDFQHVNNELHVTLFSSVRVTYPSGDTRNYWATDSHYSYNKGARRDMVEIKLPRDGHTGVAQLIAFVRLQNLPVAENTVFSSCVLIRWMSASPRSNSRDDNNRPLCKYPLCDNHCLWRWADSRTNRVCLTKRGVKQNIFRQCMYTHFPVQKRDDIMKTEIRARYDIIEFNSILRHANITVDPSTGHMLQSIQII